MEGPMVLLEDSNRVVKVNQSKIIKDRDAFHDVPLPEILEPKSTLVDTPTEPDKSLEKYQKWERTDKDAETFVFFDQGWTPLGEDRSPRNL